MNDFLLYGSTGFVGEAIARMAVDLGFTPILAGRNQIRLQQLSDELDLEHRVLSLDDPQKINEALERVKVVLNCAGPFIHTFKPIVKACLHTGTHYLDITGEPPVFHELADMDYAAGLKKVMLLPGVGFDVVPTDCLAVHLKKRLPSATHLTLAFQSTGPGGMPPEIIKTRSIDFGQGPQTTTRITWGDVFTAWHSTGIPNIEDYAVLPVSIHKKMRMVNRLRPLFRIPMVRDYLKRSVKPGPSTHTRSQTKTHVWGEVTDDQGGMAVSRLHGPEAGVEWTGRAALAAVQKVLTDAFEPGFQTPAKVYGADFALECEGVTREDI
jgi:short subunit dehydrogenase-like uncharacterized protein